MTLTGRSAVVTGGSRGIGFEICRALLGSGCDAMAVSQSESNLTRARERLPGLSVLQADVSSPGGAERIAEWVAGRWGRLDFLVNNAGVYTPGEGDLTGRPEAVFLDTLRVNVVGPYLCTRRLLPLLLGSDDPRVVNVGSSMGIVSPGLTGAYSVSKAALHALTVATANELRGKVAVNVLLPGWVRTDMAPDAPGDPRTSAEAALALLSLDAGVTGKVFDREGEVAWSAR